MQKQLYQIKVSTFYKILHFYHTTVKLYLLVQLMSIISCIQVPVLCEEWHHCDAENEWFWKQYGREGQSEKYWRIVWMDIAQNIAGVFVCMWVCVCSLCVHLTHEAVTEQASVTTVNIILVVFSRGRCAERSVWLFSRVVERWPSPLYSPRLTHKDLWLRQRDGTIQRVTVSWGRSCWPSVSGIHPSSSLVCIAFGT